MKSNAHKLMKSLSLPCLRLVLCGVLCCTAPLFALEVRFLSGSDELSGLRPGKPDAEAIVIPNQNFSEPVQLGSTPPYTLFQLRTDPKTGTSATVPVCRFGAPKGIRKALVLISPTTANSGEKLLFSASVVPDKDDMRRSLNTIRIINFSSKTAAWRLAGNAEGRGVLKPGEFTNSYTYALPEGMKYLAFALGDLNHSSGEIDVSYQGAVKTPPGCRIFYLIKNEILLPGDTHVPKLSILPVYEFPPPPETEATAVSNASGTPGI